MKYHTSKVRDFTLLSLLPVFLCFIFFSTDTSAQGMRMDKGEIAACVIKTNNGAAKTSPTGRIYKVEPNQMGVFKQVSNIKPSEKLFIEMMYPASKAGEKIVINVLDGGKLDNGKGVKVLLINKDKKCAFGFQVSDDAGLYRLLVRKGSDTKVVQLWVGNETAAIKN